MSAMKELWGTQVALLILLPFGFYALYGFAFKNGFIWTILPLIKDQKLADGTSYAPGFTRILPLDWVLGGLLTCFSTIFDGKNPYLSLANIPFAGQYVAVYALAIIEETRRGNRGRFCITGAGLCAMVHSMGFATIIPFYLYRHLSHSGAVVNPSLSSICSNDAEALTLQAGPLAIFLSYILTTTVISLPAPDILSNDAKMNGIVLWLFFAAAGHFSLKGFKTLLQNFGLTSKPKAGESIDTFNLRMLRRFYKFGIIIPAVAHIYAVSVSMSAYLFPGLFAPEQAAQLAPSRLFVPTSPFRNDVQVKDLAEAVHYFMQWDYIIGATSYVVWALTLRYLVSASSNKDFLGNIFSVPLWDWLDIAVRIAVLGPIAAAVSLVWERDEIVFEEQSRSKDVLKKM